MKNRLDNKVALITGAGSGIGKAIALLFAEEGAKVTCLDLNNGEQTANEIKEIGGNAIGISADVSNGSDIENAIKDTINTYKKLDIMVNVAGIVATQSFDSVTKIAEDEWDKIINVNLKGTMWCARYAIPEMKKLDKGKIVNISSIGSLVGLKDLAAYSASKGGVNSLTRQMAIQFAKDNICVNAIAPGIIKTPIQNNIPEEMREFHIQETPLNRLGKPSEIASLTLFLSSDEADFITGQIYAADGGWTTH